MMTNLHTRSTPTRDPEDQSLSQAIRQGQREAIAEALAQGTDGPPAVPQVVSLPYRRLSACSRFRRAVRTWFLMLGTYLVIGAWSLELQAASPFLAEVPAPAGNALGSWLISATAALSILALGKQFMRKTPLEAEFLTKREFQDFKDKDFADLRNRIEHSHESLSNKLDSINTRLSEVGSLVARLDERTKVHNVQSASTESADA